MTSVPEVLSLDEVADMLGATQVTPRNRRRFVRQLIADGQLRPIVPTVGARCLKVARHEVLRYRGDIEMAS